MPCSQKGCAAGGASEQHSPLANCLGIRPASFICSATTAALDRAHLSEPISKPYLPIFDFWFCSIPAAYFDHRNMGAVAVQQITQRNMG